MENLNKSQIILLTLLVSFVTSIATGIVTVTLLDQAPPGVTRTINRIVERTIETVVPGENQVTTITKEIIIKEEDLIPDAVEKSSKSIVEIKAINGDGAKVTLGLGVIISGDGYFVTDKKRIVGNRNNLVIEYAGVSLSAVVVSDQDDEFAVLKIFLPEVVVSKDEGVGDDEKLDDVTEKTLPIFVPASLSDSNDVRLGQKVLALDGSRGVKMGIVSSIKKIEVEKEDEVEDVVLDVTEKDLLNEDNVKNKENNITGFFDYIITDIILDKKSIGGPLVSTSGDMLGLSITDSVNGEMVVVPVNRVKDTFFEIINSLEKVIESDLDKEGNEPTPDTNKDLTESQ